MGDRGLVAAVIRKDGGGRRRGIEPDVGTIVARRPGGMSVRRVGPRSQGGVSQSEASARSELVG